MFCNKCGTKLEDDAKFCPNCGGKITAGTTCEEKTVQTKKKRSTSPIKIYIIVAVSVCILGAIAVVLPKVFRKISYQQEVRKTEKAIENAFDSITDVEEFTCHIEATAQLYTTANGNQVNDGITVQSDTTFKGDKVHAESGSYYSLMMNQQGGMHIEEFSFEFYVTENNLAYSKKDEGSFERVDANFSRDDMLEFFDEVIENYNEEPRYSSGEEAGTIKISGMLSDGIEIYNTYIDFLVLSGAEPEDYPISDTMNYNVIISKESETVQSITLYLSDVEHIWLGWGSDGLQVDNAYGELTIEFQSLEDIADFDLPSVAEEAEQAFENTDEWQKTYLAGIDDGIVISDDYIKYDLKDLNEDDIPELIASIGTGEFFIYTTDSSQVKEVMYGAGSIGTNGDLILFDGRYEMVICRMSPSFEHDTLFVSDCANAYHLYDYEGNSVSYDEIKSIAEQVIRCTFDSFEYLQYPYDCNSIRTAIVEYNCYPSLVDLNAGDIPEEERIPDYILPYSDSAYLTEADLTGLTPEQLRIARNEIYARHGRIFKDEELAEYFGGKSWYYPITEEVLDTELNEYEIANRDLIVSLENAAGE